MKLQCRFDRGALARQPVVVDAGATAGPAGRAAAEQRRAQGRGRRGIGYAHFADDQQVAIVRHRVAAGIDRVEEIFGVHRRRNREIARRPFEFERNHVEFGAGQRGELVDGGAAGSKIRHHLRGDLRRIGRDAARGDAVITGEHRDRDPLQSRRGVLLPSRPPDRQFFEAAEAARRLGQVLLPPGCGAGGVRIARGQSATELAYVIEAVKPHAISLQRHLK